MREQGIKTLIQISATEEFPELHTTEIVPQHREGTTKQLEAGVALQGPPPTAGPLPQPIHDVLCLSKINLIQCTSDFVFHVLEKKAAQQLLSALSCRDAAAPGSL